MKRQGSITIAMAASLVFGSGTARAQSSTEKGNDPPKNPEVEIGDKHDEAQKTAVPGAASPARPEVDAASEPPKRGSSQSKPVHKPHGETEE